RFRRDHAFHLARTETLPVLRKTLGQTVAHERGGGGPARGDAEPGADRRSPQGGDPIARQDLPGLPDNGGIDARDLALEGKPLLHGQQNLANAEKAYDSDEEIEAAQQLRRAEGEPEL